MINNIKIINILIIFLGIIYTAFSQNCIEVYGGCQADIDSCVNDICEKCDNNNDIASSCYCPTGYYFDLNSQQSNKCEICHDNCLNCSGPLESECISCEPLKGWKYNNLDKTCECVTGYLPTGNLQNPCQKCYMYGDQCVLECPPETEQNEKYMQCESQSDTDVSNDDDIYYVVITICLIVLIIMLTLLLYKYFYQMFKQIFEAEKDKQYPLTEEELYYLENQQEIEKQRRENEELLAQQLIEEQKKREEEEKQRIEEAKERERIRIQEEEEERQRQLEEEQRQLEEEKQRRIKEEERLLEMAREEERLKKEEEERIRQEQQEKERNRLKELARQAREQRKMERQLTRQTTIASNEAKLKNLRDQREALRLQKLQMEQHNQNCLLEAEDINGNFEIIGQKISESQLKKEKSIQLRKDIILRQQNIRKQKLELDQALEGVDFAAALEKVENIEQEDIVFLQNLRTPPDRVRICLEAVVMAICAQVKKPEWDAIKKEISNMNFRKNLKKFDPEQMPDKVFNKIQKDYTDNPQWNLKKIYKASIAAGAFAEWLSAIINYKKLKIENAPLFAKIQELKLEEQNMQDEVDQLQVLEEEEQKYDFEQEQLDKQSSQYKEKQKMLQRQATLNLPDIQEKEEQIAALDTNNVSLEEIQESEEEEGNSSDLNSEDQRALDNI